ncbi:hypothetical protein CAPTEDRAFT_185029 [Capitella teleta]|uniref:Centromere protein M n=1 Tax=Capitella teleta TaxID=283909 RepID=R7T5V1_CAPTE|nr:hypothetical protein CAPTEDRAFT_185029 [Capitella teleta]|eukprot:ELT88588.1 hypothetical protein CAPTEDRAFT_185029 [Capitella teleta]
MALEVKHPSQVAVAVTKAIVGEQGVGKPQLAEMLLREPLPFKLTIRMASRLPLPEETQQAPVDFVVFMFDICNKHSYQSTCDSATHLAVNYYLGKVCFVVTQLGNPYERTVDMDTVSELTNSYDSPKLFANFCVSRANNPLDWSCILIITSHHTSQN